jgi:hypothetical protein
MVKQVGYTFVGIVAILVALVLCGFILSTMSVLIDGHGWVYVVWAAGIALAVYAVNRLGKFVYRQLPCHG